MSQSCCGIGSACTVMSMSPGPCLQPVPHSVPGVGRRNSAVDPGAWGGGLRDGGPCWLQEPLLFRAPRCRAAAFKDSAADMES